MDKESCERRFSRVCVAIKIHIVRSSVLWHRAVCICCCVLLYYDTVLWSGSLQDSMGSILILKSSIFWNITTRSPLKVRWKQSPACYLLHAGFLLCLFFDTENGGDMFLRNVCWLSTDYTALYPRRQNSSLLWEPQTPHFNIILSICVQVSLLLTFSNTFFSLVFN
jgi:hypothetical protein